MRRMWAPGTHGYAQMKISAIDIAGEPARDHFVGMTVLGAYFSSGVYVRCVKRNQRSSHPHTGNTFQWRVSVSGHHQ